MPTKSIAYSEAVRELAPDDWCRALLEEVLFRAAQKISTQDSAIGSVDIQLEISIRPDLGEHRLVVSTPGAVERAIVTHLPL